MNPEVHCLVLHWVLESQVRSFVDTLLGFLVVVIYGFKFQFLLSERLCG